MQPYLRSAPPRLGRLQITPVPPPSSAQSARPWLDQAVVMKRRSILLQQGKGGPQKNWAYGPSISVIGGLYGWLWLNCKIGGMIGEDISARSSICGKQSGGIKIVFRHFSSYRVKTFQFFSLYFDYQHCWVEKLTQCWSAWILHHIWCRLSIQLIVSHLITIWTQQSGTDHIYSRPSSSLSPGSFIRCSDWVTKYACSINVVNNSGTLYCWTWQEAKAVTVPTELLWPILFNLR